MPTHSADRQEAASEAALEPLKPPQDASAALLDDAYRACGYLSPDLKDYPFSVSSKRYLENSQGKTEIQDVIQTDASRDQFKAAFDLSNAVLSGDSTNSQELMQEAMDQGQLKNILQLTNCLLGNSESSKRLSAVDSVEKVTYTENQGTHSREPKSAQFDNARATVYLVDLQSGRVEALAKVKNDPIRKGYDAPDL